MSSRESLSGARLELPAATGTGRRIAWHAVAVLLAASVAWLILSAYRHPDLLLDLAAMRLC